MYRPRAIPTLLCCTLICYSLLWALANRVANDETTSLLARDREGVFEDDLESH